jgi:hypothetical protein
VCVVNNNEAGLIKIQEKETARSLKTATKEDLGKQRLIKIQEKETTMSLKTATEEDFCHCSRKVQQRVYVLGNATRKTGAS